VSSETVKLRELKIVTPGRKVFAVFCLLLSLWFSSGWIFSMVSHLNPATKDVSRWELEAQMNSIERRLSMGEDELLVMLIPEGTLFCNSLFGFAVVNMGLQCKADDPFRARSIKQVEWLLERVEKLAKRHPFNANDNLNPKGGIILAGHTNLLRAGYVQLGGKNPAIREAFQRESKVIFDAFMATKTGFPECYQGYTWAQDSVYALESLRLCDQINGTEYGAAITKWTDSIRNHIDEKTGLMVAQVDPATGKSIEGARGCAVAWGLTYMPRFDADFARAQYERFKADWLVHFIGCAGVTEWYHGRAEPTNFHAGPVVFGLGMAASGIGIAASRANGDYVSANKLLRSLEFFGVPTVTPSNEKSYFFGVCLLADVVSIWGKTTDPISPSESLPEAPVSLPPDNYFVAIGIAALISALLILGFLRNVLITLRSNPKTVHAGWRQATIVACVLHSIAIGAFFFVPALTWLQIVFFMAVVDMLEELTVRPSIIGKLSREQN
jgi:hypothetical protein